MAKIPLISTGLASALIGGNTYYSVVAASGINFETTEANAQLTYRTAGTFSGLFIHVLTNTTLNASTLRIRINGANGNQSVTIPAATTGSFEDTSNTDTIASGDKVNYSIAVGSGLGTISAIREISIFFDASSGDTVCRHAIVNIPALATVTNYYYPLSDVPPDVNSTESRANAQVNAGMSFQHEFVYVSANGITDNTVIRLRVNNTNVTNTLTVGSGATGIFEDTAHTDTVVANDNVNWRINAGATGTNITIKILAISSVSTARQFNLIMGNTNGVAGSTDILYFSPSGRGSSATTEASRQVKMRIAALISNLVVNVSANTATGTSTFILRKNGVDTTISVSIPTVTTGFFESTNTEYIAPTDLISYALTRGGTGTVTIRSASSLVTAMVSASDIRAAEVTGKDTANSTRAAEATGKDTANDIRASEVTGKDTSNSERAAQVTGATGTDIERISSGSGTGSSISLGSHQAGDVIFFWAYRNDSATPPTLPSGWTIITSVGASVHSAIMGYKVCSSGSETSGTWTNATSVAYAIYRNVDTTTPYSHPSGQSGTGTSVSWSGIAPSIDNPGRDWVFTTFGATSDVGNMDTHPPTSCTLITDYSNSGVQECTIYDTNAPVSSYSFNSKTADASITWLTKTVAIRAVPTGTGANDTRTAEVTGKDTANSSRAAEVTGKDTSNDERDAETTGKDTSTSNRPAETSGVDTANSTRAAEVTGKDISSSIRAAETTGKDTASSIRASETSGVDTTFSTRAAEVTGKDSASSTRAAEVTGIEGSQSERDSEVSGKDSASDIRSAEVTGKDTDSSQRNSEITGQDTAFDDRNAETSGTDTSFSERPSETTGSLSSSEERAAETSGVDTSSYEIEAEVTGKDSAISEISSEASGKDTAQDSRSAETSGNDNSVSERPASTIGITTIENLQDDFNDNSLDTSKWGSYGSGVSEASSMLQISSSLTAEYTGITSVNEWDLRESSIFIKLVSAGDQSIPSFEVYPLYLSSENSDNHIEFVVRGGNIIAGQVVGGGAYQVLWTDIYDSAVHVFLRIRENSGVVYFEYSNNAISWTVAFSFSDPFDVSHLTAGILVGTWQSELSTTIAIFDNLNIPTIPANDSRDAETYGKDSTNDSRDAEVTGNDSSNSERSAEVTGASSSTENESRTVVLSTGSFVIQLKSGNKNVKLESGNMRINL